MNVMVLTIINHSQPSFTSVNPHWPSRTVAIVIIPRHWLDTSWIS